MQGMLKELVDEACKYAYNATRSYSGDEPIGFMDYYTEKLAELIVRECMNIAYEYDSPKMSGPGMIIAGQIEEHFGVEE